MRFTATGLVVVSVLGLGGIVGCGDRKRDAGGLPPSDEWKAPPTSDAAAAAVETVEETLSRCIARSFVADADRDGNLPADAFDGLVAVPDKSAVVVLRALVSAASRLPRADQHAMLVAMATLGLLDHGDPELARASLEKVDVLLDRPADDEFRPEIAAASAARAWGRLADAEAVKRLGGDPRVAPHLARGLAEGGHDQLADEALRRADTFDRVDPFASAELAITDLIRGRIARARARVARAPGDWRSVHTLLLATAAVERKHPEARALLAEAIKEIDRESPPPSVQLELARMSQTLGDTDTATARRAKLRVDISFEKDRERVFTGLYGLYELAVEAGARDEAAAVFSDLEERGAPPWALTLARADGFARAGELQRAVEDVARLPDDAKPPRGVVHLQVLVRYLARTQRDPALESWLVEHVCDG